MKISRTERCLHHPAREAVARCPECEHFFCRECISEHDDRVLCARCLTRGAREPKRSGPRFAKIIRLAAAVVGLLATWWYFDLVAKGLMRLPASVHEGTVWEKVTSGE